ncbi:hypothetical protein [Longimicrobium sp.]|uniref:hypothetical protein n=1 Tax=Longimicrobium sp. TaxID=2029185 RepID=UPI002E302EB5|nr:hypothetical protein [Longimicrobium sp.]HEX6039448.1 hypothetical protein [Longimicrobium sp.]
MIDDWTEADDAIEEVHEIRRRIWAQFDNDPEKVVAHYMELDKQFAERMVKSPRRDSTGISAA